MARQFITRRRAAARRQRRPRFTDVVHATLKASHLYSEPGTTIRADVASLKHDGNDDRIPALVNAGLASVTLRAAAPDRWQRSAVFGHNVKHVWGLVQGSFGFNLDVIVETTDGSLQHYYRNGDGWNEGVLINA